MGSHLSSLLCQFLPHRVFIIQKVRDRDGMNTDLGLRRLGGLVLTVSLLCYVTSVESLIFSKPQFRTYKTG